MKLIKRIKNLWRLSESSGMYELPNDSKRLIVGIDTAYPEFKRDKMAQIVRMKPIEEDIEKLLEETNQEKKDDNN